MDFFDLLRRRLDVHDEVEAAYLFGSHARGSADPGSDLDVAVLFRPDAAGPAALSADLMGDVSAETGRPMRVDVVDLDRISPVMASRVLTTGRLILSKNESRRVAFEVAAVRRYVDTAPLRRIFHEAQSRRIAEGRFGMSA